MARNQAATQHGAQNAPTPASALLKALYDEKESWRKVADSVGGVSAALCWKVAHGVTESNKVDIALGIPTQPRCKANGWLRRAAWLHETQRAAYERWLQRQGVGSLQELVDKGIEQEMG